MLEVSGLNQFYGESHTLWDIDLTIKQGECICLMGRNGVGKTTLLHLICGKDIDLIKVLGMDQGHYDCGYTG